MFSVANYLGRGRRMLSYAEPGRTAAAHPVWGIDQLRVVLPFRTPIELAHNQA